MLHPFFQAWELDDRSPFDEELPIIQDLGAWLRRERERAGVTLETIAAAPRSPARCWRPSSATTSRAGRTASSGGPSSEATRARSGWTRLRRRAVHPGFDGPQASPVLDRATARAAVSAGAASSGRAEPSLRLTLAPEVSRWQEALARLGAATTDLMAPITLALPSGCSAGCRCSGSCSRSWGCSIHGRHARPGDDTGLWMMQRVGSQPLGARRMPWARRRARSASARRRRRSPRGRGHPPTGLDSGFGG